MAAIGHTMVAIGNDIYCSTYLNGPLLKWTVGDGMNFTVLLEDNGWITNLTTDGVNLFGNGNIYGMHIWNGESWTQVSAYSSETDFLYVNGRFVLDSSSFSHYIYVLDSSYSLLSSIYHIYENTFWIASIGNYVYFSYNGYLDRLDVMNPDLGYTRIVTTPVTKGAICNYLGTLFICEYDPYGLENSLYRYLNGAWELLMGDVEHHKVCRIDSYNNRLYLIYVNTTDGGLYIKRWG